MILFHLSDTRRLADGLQPAPDPSQSIARHIISTLPECQNERHDDLHGRLRTPRSAAQTLAVATTTHFASMRSMPCSFVLFTPPGLMVRCFYSSGHDLANHASGKNRPKLQVHCPSAARSAPRVHLKKRLEQTNTPFKARAKEDPTRVTAIDSVKFHLSRSPPAVQCPSSDVPHRSGVSYRLWMSLSAPRSEGPRYISIIRLGLVLSPIIVRMMSSPKSSPHLAPH